MSQLQLAKAVGYADKTMISKIEKGEVDLQRSKIEAFAKALRTSPAELMGWTKTPAYQFAIVKDEEADILTKYRLLDDYGRDLVNSIIDTYLRKDMRLYPYYHHIAAAGTGFYFEDIPVDTIEAPEMAGADFIIGVSGDSMEPTYSDGDDLYIQRAQRVRTGEIGIFLVDGTCLVKELGPDGLVSHNPSYKTIDGTSNIRCVGRVLGRVKR